MIKFTCSCGKPVECPDSRAGKRGRCPFCGAVWSMPLLPSTPLLPWHVPGRAYLVDPMSIDLSGFGASGPDDPMRQSFAEGRCSGFLRQGETIRRFPPGAPPPLPPHDFGDPFRNMTAEQIRVMRAGILAEFGP